MAITRRGLLKVAGGTVATGAVAALGLNRWLNPNTPLNYVFEERADALNLLMPTPSCGNQTTTAQTEGPFYTPTTPNRSNLREPDTVGVPLVIEGRVLGSDCTPLKGAVLDVWGCDGKGVYDNEGFKLRGHQFTDSQGFFRIETVKPSDYSQFFVHRTPHLHVKVQGRESALLTTQLYFPGDPLNADDIIFNESLVVRVENSGDGMLHAFFDFVLSPRQRTT